MLGRGRDRRLRFEDLEPRLALTWLGVPPAAVAVPTSAVAVTLNSAADASGLASIASTEVDYYAFTATRSGSYTISAATPASTVDTVLGVFSSAGGRIAYNDDIVYAVNTDSRVTVSLTAGTRYYVGITNFTSGSRGSYTWTIDGPNGAAAPTTATPAPTTTPVADDGYENNDSFGAAYNLGTLSSARTIGSLALADANDWYRFTTTGTGTSASSVSLSFANSRGDLQLALYSSTGSLLATSAGTGNSESVSLNGRAAGTYFVRVYGNNGALNPSYSLTVNPAVASTTTTTTTPTTTTAPATSTPTTTPTTTGGFQITLSMSGLTASQQAIFQQAASRWQQIIVGDLPNATYHGLSVDDMLINASSVFIDGVNGILGQAGPDALRSGSALPYHGIMQFDSADMASMEQSGLLFSVVLHEMGHVLGIGTIWQNLGMLSGAGTSNPIFVGAHATAAYNQLFGTSARGVPVENTGGAGTADGHWRETVFVNELMTGWAGPGTNLPVSSVTVASLADIGYTVNMAAANSYTPTSSGLATARSAAGSGSASILAFGNSPVESSVVEVAEVGVSSHFPRAPVGSLPAQSLAMTPSDANLVDRVLGGSSKKAAESPDSSLHRPDSRDEYDIAWDQFGLDWELSPSVAVL